MTFFRSDISTVFRQTAFSACITRVTRQWYEAAFPRRLVSPPGVGGLRHFITHTRSCSVIIWQVASPTGSGKTSLFELAILGMLKDQAVANVGTGRPSLDHRTRGQRKAIYVAPMRSLVQEKAQEWKERLGRTLGLTVNEFTGEHWSNGVEELERSDIILTTPERFDSITRRSDSCRNSNTSFLSKVHLVHARRGPSAGGEPGALARGHRRQAEAEPGPGPAPALHGVFGDVQECRGRCSMARRASGRHVLVWERDEAGASRYQDQDLSVEGQQRVPVLEETRRVRLSSADGILQQQAGTMLLHHQGGGRRVSPRS